MEGLIELGRQDMDPSRRGVLGVGLFSIALTVPGWQDVLGRLEAFKTGRATRIGMPEVDMVIDMTAKISELDDQFGGRHARPMAAAFLVNTVAGYLHADGPEKVRRAMMAAASDLSYLTGYMAVDEGLHGLAQRYYVKALELAGAADDHLTYCTTLRGMSVQAVDLGHGSKAMALADAAAAASPAAGPRMRAFLAVAGSVEAMEQSDQLRFGVYRRARVRHRATLAERQLRLGHLEAAWRTALDEWPMVQSGRADDRMRTMVELIKPHTANAHARSLCDQARATLPASMH
ncbi:transcriptional regulator [Streptomyces bauhiniae]|uniref:transcriptional regulator n=1 Tax=Streptomyces bauhiniae TaxID=2340725 RepID=UPI0037F9EEBF